MGQLEEVALLEMSSNRVRDIVQGKQEYPVKTKKFWVPELDLIAPYVKKELENNFKNVSVSVMDCPDLTKFGCAAPGLGGNSKLVEGGGEPFNHDLSYNKEIHFKMERMARLAGHGPGSYLQGAGAACAAQLRGHIGELVPCLVVGGTNLTKAARVGVKKEAIIEEDKTLMCGGISNLYLCQGEKEKVLEVKVSCRTGQQASLTQVIRSGLNQVPGVGGEKQLGMGGVFRMESGSAKAHVNPDFEVLPENYYDRKQMKCVKDFLQFYTFPAPLLCFTCLWTDEPKEGPTLNLRGSGEHTHFWREKNGLDYDPSAGGHYHGDTEPEQVSYTGYFSLAGEVVRIWDAVEQKLGDIN